MRKHRFVLKQDALGAWYFRNIAGWSAEVHEEHIEDMSTEHYIRLDERTAPSRVIAGVAVEDIESILRFGINTRFTNRSMVYTADTEGHLRPKDTAIALIRLDLYLAHHGRAWRVRRSSVIMVEGFGYLLQNVRDASLPATYLENIRERGPGRRLRYSPVAEIDRFTNHCQT